MAAVLYMLPLPLLDVARLTVAAHSPGPLTARVTALVAWLSVSARQQLWWWCALRILSLSDWYDHYTLGTWCWDRTGRIGRLWSAREVKSEESLDTWA